MTTTFSPFISTSTSPLSIASCSAEASAWASISPSDPASPVWPVCAPVPWAAPSRFWVSPSTDSSVLVCSSSSGFCSSVVSCVISLVTEGLGEGLNSSCRSVVPCGCSTTGTTFCTPKAFWSEPEICLNFGTLNSANDRISTKNAMSSVAMSANVAIQAGAPTGGHFGHSSGAASSTSSTSAALAAMA